MNNHLREPKWEYALTENEAEIIAAFFDLSDELSVNANSGQELEDAETTAITEIARRYGMTYEELDNLLTKFNMAYFGN
jgi:hypothetical protein